MEQTNFAEAAAQAVIDVGAGEASLLDVRRDDEWAAGHAVGATHWELARLEAGEFPDIPKDRPVFVHCAAGVRAEKAKEILEQNGWEHVTNIGGLKDWEDAGGLVEE
jgi:rhodanese-related sulfurtransferase